MAIVKDGKVYHQKGYGVQSVETQQPVTENTNFSIASISKAFTATALALLVEEGKLGWKDKVVDHLPEFKMYNDYVTENFNVQDLLTHRSGLGLGAGDLMFFPDGADFTIQDILTSFQYFEPVSAFRTQFDYDNLLYLVAGELITRITGMPFEAYIKKNILDPLEMDSSYTSLQEIKDKNTLAMPHSTGNGSMRQISHIVKSINGAAGGIFSNVNDMSKWMLVHLNEGRYGKALQDTLFSEESQREMWRVHTVKDQNLSPVYNSHFSGYGLGWNLNDVQGNLMLTHTGGLPGMLSKIVLVPDLELGILVLTNTEDGGSGVFSAVSNTILDSYLGIKNQDWTGKYVSSFSKRQEAGDIVTTEVWETVKTADNSRLDPQKFVGTYKDNWFGKVEVSIKNGQLWMTSLRSPKLNGPMKLYKDNIFAIKWEYQDMNADALATFSLDETGKAQNIKLKGISPNIDFSFDFQDLDLQRVGD